VQALSWGTIIEHAWSFTYLQIAKSFILHRIDVKSLFDLPGTDASKLPFPGALTSSNVYSPAESILLAWLELHVKKIMPQAAHRLATFDEHLADAVALCCVLVSHWAGLGRFLGQLVESPVNEAECESNARVVVRMLEVLQCPFKLKEEHIARAKSLDMLFFVAYLYNWLPQLIPRSTIEFVGKLQEEQLRDVELTNPTKKGISYEARLQGHTDFTLENHSIRMEPGGKATCRIKCTPTTGVTQTSSLILSSKKDGGAIAATLVFQLVSKVTRCSFCMDKPISGAAWFACWYPHECAAAKVCLCRRR
jgi:hypothetical protein